MKTYVLVHGAYHGAWCWKRIVPLFQEKGAAVFTPTLCGLGEKSGMLSPEINLSTHISDVVNFVKKEGLKSIILVGHSYAGFVVCAAAQVMPERIAHLVYLDAMVPLNGQRVFDIRPSLRPKGVEIAHLGRKIKVLMPAAPQAYGIEDPQDVEWAKALLVPMPFACYDEPLTIDDKKLAPLKKTYLLNEIQSPGESQKSHEDTYIRAQGDNWSRLKIPGPHDSMLTHPQELAEILLKI